MKTAIIIGLSICTFLSSCSRATWSGFFYPNKSDLSVDVTLGEFSSLEECRSAARAMMQLPGNENGDYECGLNCRSSAEKPRICEATEK
jgi:hypothetical protein